MADHSRLGRGLAALMGDVGEETTSSSDASRKPRRAPIENLHRQSAQSAPQFHRGRTQRTGRLDQGARHHPADRGAPGARQGRPFEIIAGERRWRAAQRAGLHDVPIAVVEATDAQALEFAIIENVQRADLNPIEEATGYLALMEEFNHSQDDVAQIVGKSRSHVANMVRLLKLSEPVKALVQSGQLSAGHARQLLGQPNALAIAQDIIKRGLSVRQIETGNAQGRRRAGARSRRHVAQEGRRHQGAGEKIIRRAWAGGDRRSPRPGRHAAYQVSGFGSVGWGVEEVG